MDFNESCLLKYEETFENILFFVFNVSIVSVARKSAIFLIKYNKLYDFTEQYIKPPIFQVIRFYFKGVLFYFCTQNESKNTAMENYNNR